ncbi:protein Wnt-5a-like [Clavelina lepadiformis]|uniref:Protein Wnt n=1 Tax=Clavelina lepadiformis TaxID=159417 RepID=A0ABP0GBL6_CLALP
MAFKPGRRNILVPMMVIYAALISKVNCYWWSMPYNPVMDTLILGTTPLCSSLETLSVNQQALCRRYQSHMQFVSSGAKTGIEECKWQFRGDRWNCSTFDDNTVFGKVLKIGSRETAFAYAISAAGVVYSVAKACRNEQLDECGCSSARRPEGLDNSWRWGGCGDNTFYAYGFAREFIDAKERDNTKLRRGKDKARKAMNMHNNEAGRMAAVRSATPTCKCHGVSGSCSLKTCWMQIPNFRQIGDELKNLYGGAAEVRSNSRGKIRRRDGQNIELNSLVFLESSPDYCDRHRRTGVTGTRGRECEVGSHGPDGCGFLCCGRGSTPHQITETVKCRCKFEWCCEVKCDTCRNVVERHICN